MKLIDKDTIVAEIKKLKDEAKIHPSDFNCGRLSICKELMNFLNTLEVKEVDFEKEWKEYFKYRGDMATVNIIHLAKHFFELGLNARKGE